MNKKAQKQTINFPLQLNMAKNKPTVDNTFSKADSNNAPYLNEMLQPTYIKEYSGKRVYDHYGNYYKIEDGWLTRNGEQLFQVDNKYFIRKQFTNLDKYIAWDMHENEGYGARIYNGTVYIDLLNSDGSVATSSIKEYNLYAFGHNIEARIKFVNNEAIFVILYNDSSVNKLFAVNLSTDTIMVDKIDAWWKQFVVSYNPSWLNAANYVNNSRESYGGCCITSQDIDIVNPIINISSVDNIPAFSIVSQFGVAIDSNNLWWITVLPTKKEDSDDIKWCELGYDIAPDISQTTITTIPETVLNIRFKQTKTTTNDVSVAIYTSDNKQTWKWYDYNGDFVDMSLTIPDSITPTNTNNTTTIDGTIYNIYTVPMTRYRLTIAVLSQEEIDYTIKVNYSNSNYLTGASSNKEAIITYDIYQFSGSTAPSLSVDSFDVSWSYSSDITPTWEDTPISSSYIGQGYYTSIRYGNSEQTTASWAVAPDVILDNGNMYSIWKFHTATNAWINYNNNKANRIKVGSVLVESCVPHIHTSSAGEWPTISQFDFDTIESISIENNNQCPRSNSFAVNQNMIQVTALFNNSSATSPKALAEGTTETSGSRFSSYMNNPSIDLTYSIGYSRYSGYNYYGDTLSDYSTTSGAAEDSMVYTVGGSRQVINDDNWYMLYNTNLDRSMYIHGISFANDHEEMGTLLTPWDSIDDSEYISATGNRVIYKSINGNYYEIDLVTGDSPILTILDDKYIIVNTTSYANCYDSVNNKIMHYASDYNDRTVFGTTSIEYFQGYNVDAAGQLLYGRTTATGINASYQIQRNAIVSIIPSYVNRYRINVSNCFAYNCMIPSIEIDFLGIDIYYSDVNTGSSPKYRFTILPYSSYVIYTKQELVNSSWTISSATMLSAALFSEYINGAGANDMIVTDKYNYPLKYYNTEPYLLYIASSGTANVTSTLDETTSDTYGKSEFFCIQGQFYGIVNDKLYSIVYSNGNIAEMDAIVDCRGMKFIGNNPRIAFLWDPQNKVIRSFTGDAILEAIWPASKFNNINGSHFYDETSQQIFIPTDKGLLVISDKSIYMHEQWKNVSLVQFSADNVTHIINDDTTIDLVYYKEEGYIINPIKLETEFFGLGNNELTSIDRWDIILYDMSEEHPSVDIKCKAISINDVTTNSDERVYKIKPADYDSYSHSVLLAFNPKLIKAKGLKLFIESPLIIKSITPHIMDDGTGIATKHSI